MSGEGYPAGGSGSMSAAQILRRLTAASTLAVGAMLFGAGTASLTTLGAGTNGYVLTMAAGVPSWAINPGAALPASYAVGDTLYASSTSALSRLAAVAVGQVLISAGVGAAPAWSASPSVAGIITAKPTTTAGIALDPNAATGNFTLSLSPANITAARRWSFPDRSDTVAGLGAQTFSGQQIINANLGLGIAPGTGGGSAAFWLVADGASYSGGLQCSVSGAVKGYVYYDVSSTAFTLQSAASTDLTLSTGGTTRLRVASATGAILIGTEPGGSELLRVGGGIRATAGRFSSSVNVTGPNSTGAASQCVLAQAAPSQCTLNSWGVNASTSGAINFQCVSSDATISSFPLSLTHGTPGTPAANEVFIGNGTIKAAANVVIGTDPGGSSLLRVGGSLFNSLGTITTAQQAVDSSVTWNSGATAFTGWKLNVTDTASAAGSLLLDLQVGGVSKFSVRKDGLIKAATLSGFTGSTAGEIWSSSDQNCLQIYSGAITQNVSTVTYSCQNIANSVGPSNTVTETSIIVTNGAVGSLTFPANFFKAQKRIRVKLRGVVGNTGTPTLNLKVKLGSVVMATTGVVTMVTTSGQKFSEIEADISCSSAGAGGGFASVITGQYGTSATALASFGAAQQTSVVDTTAAQTLSITAQFGTADVLNVMIYAYALVEVLN